jgi:hypothetical protein
MRPVLLRIERLDREEKEFHFSLHYVATGQWHETQINWRVPGQGDAEKSLFVHLQNADRIGDILKQQSPAAKKRLLVFCQYLDRHIARLGGGLRLRALPEHVCVLLTEEEIAGLDALDDRIASETILAAEQIRCRAYAAAAERLRKLYSLNPHVFDVQLLLGQVCLALRQREVGEKLLQLAVNASKANGNRLLYVGHWLFRHGENELAVFVLQTLVQRFKGQVFARYLLAQIYYSSGDTRYQALLRELAEENPLLCDEYLRLAWDFQLKHSEMTLIDTDEAAALLERENTAEVEGMAARGELPASYCEVTDRFSFYREEVAAWRDFKRFAPSLAQSSPAQ